MHPTHETAIADAVYHWSGTLVRSLLRWISCRAEAMPSLHHAGTGATRIFENGRKLKAIRNAPRPMPHAPI